MSTRASDRTVDIVLGLAAAALVVLHVYIEASGASRRAPDVSSEVLSSIEATGITLDADRALTRSTRVAIGLEGKAPAQPKNALLEARRALLEEHPDTRTGRLVWAAVALSFRLDAEANEELARVALDERASSLQPITDGLRDLAAGRSTKLPPLEVGLRELGASPWLIAAMRERDAANRGDESSRRAADDAAIALAVQAADTDAADALITLILFALGGVSLIAVPLVLRSRWMRARGFVGLVQPSPFRLDRTRRVMFLWFLLYNYAAYALLFLLSPFVVGAADPAFVAMFGGLQSAMSALLAVVLVRRLASKPEIAAPLAEQLGLSTRLLPGGWRGLLVWALPGLAMVALVTTLVMMVSRLITGPPDQPQDLLTAVQDGGGFSVTLIAVIGAALIAPIGEEILFRGFLFRNLRDTLGPWPAIVLSGFIFAAVHMIPQLLIPLAAMGMVLALLYQWSGSLLVPIAAHALWNLLNLLEAHLRFHV